MQIIKFIIKTLFFLTIGLIFKCIRDFSGTIKYFV